MIKRLLVSLFLLHGLFAYSQEKFQLAEPMLKFESVFFKESTSLTILFNQPGAEVHYTLDGREPVETDLVYRKPIVISGQTMVKAKAFGKDFAASATAEVLFVKDGKTIADIQATAPNKQYDGQPILLFDNIGGQPNYKNGHWLGYDSDTVEVNIRLQKKEKVDHVLIDLLQDEGGWIFLPEQVLLYYYDTDQQKFIAIGKESLVFDKQSPRRAVAKTIAVNGLVKTGQLKLVLLPLKQIPEWHPGKGKHAWMFIDEIKVY